MGAWDTMFTPEYAPLGPPEGGQNCMDRIIERDIDFMVAKADGGFARRGLTPMEFLWNCVMYSNLPDEQQMGLTESDAALMPIKYAEMVHILLFRGKTWVPIVVLCMFTRL